MALARTEAATLNVLAEDAELAGLVPRCFWIGDALALEDVRSTGATYAALDNEEVLRVCLTSAPMGQFRHIAERRVSGSS